MTPSLVVALDFPDAAKALGLAQKLQGLAPWVKVGLELFTAEGPAIVRSLKDMGFKVFLDLKFYDIPNTVRGATRSAARLGVDLTTLHHAGGMRMAQAARQGVEDAGGNTLLFAISVLTSTSLEEAGGLSGQDMASLVAAKARDAKAWGMDGMVCSGHEAAAVKKACGRNFYCLCPGIRLPGAGADDQRRVMTPQEAVAAGADFLVMGRPITGAPDPAQAARDALTAIA